MSQWAGATGWYSDPLGRYRWRFWTGSAWSQWVSSGTNTFEDRLPVGSVDQELAHITYAEQVVGDLRKRRLIKEREWRTVTAELHRRRQVIASGGAFQPQAWLSGLQPGAQVPPERPSFRPRVEHPAPREQVKRQAPRNPVPIAPRREAEPTPGVRTPLPEPYLAKVPLRLEPRPPREARVVPALRAVWTRLRRTLVSDLAVYGLAYLGVLLLFTGVFGLTVFSMSEVRRDLRPAAEAAVPIATFASAWLLGRHGRQMVPKTLVLLGGLLLPVVVLASFVDGASIPPDPKGGPLVFVLTGASLAIAGAYALVARRWPGSPIRFLVAPAVWLAVAMAGLAAHPTIPHAEGITRPVPWQMAAVAAAIASTLLVSRRLAAPWRTAVEWSAVPAAALTLLLTALAANARDWPAAPLVVAGAATFITIELLAHLVKPQMVAVGQALLAASVLVACVPDWGVARVGAAGAVTFAVIAEWQGWRRPGIIGTVATLGGAAVWLAVASWRPWPAVAGYSAVSVWAHIRRRWRVQWLPSSPWLAGAAAVLPAGVVGGLMAELPAGRVTVGVGCAVAVMSLVALWPHRDRFWGWWIPAAAASTAALALGMQVSVEDTAIVTGLSAVAFASASGWSWLRTWGTAASAATSMAYALAAFSTAPSTRVVVFAVTGLMMVAVGTVPPLSRGGHLGVMGHVVGIGALVATSYPLVRGAFFPALAAFTGGWVVTTAADELSGAPVVELARSVASRAAPAVGWLRRAVPLTPRLISIVSLPVLAVTAADRWGLVGYSEAGAALVVSTVAFIYVLAGRWLLADRLGELLAPAGFGFTMLAVISSMTEIVAAISIGAAIVTVAVMDPPRRLAPYDWCAWALSAPLVVLVARQAGVVGSQWYPALIVWGGALLVGVLAWDDLRNGRRNADDWVRERSMRAPAVLAAAGLIGGTAAELVVSPPNYAWWSLAVGATAAVVAWQLREGSVSLLSWSLGTVAYLVLAPWDPITRPWSVALAGVALAGLSIPLGRVVEPISGRPWLRWDLPALLVAPGLVILGLSATAAYDSVAATFCVAGGLATGVWALRRRVLWLYIADVLFLVAASDTNQGWMALVLLAVAVEATLLAIRAERWERVVLQMVSVVTFAAGAVLLGRWLGAAADQAAVGAALAGGAVLASAGAAVRRSRELLEWVAPWAVTAVVALVGASAALFNGSVTRAWPGGAVSGGLLAASIGFAVAARPLNWPVLRDAAAATFVAAGAAVLYSTSPPAWVTVLAAIGAGLAAATLASIANSLPARQSWTRPLILVAAISTVGAAGVSGFERPGPGSASLLLMATTTELLLAAVSARGWLRLALDAAATAALAGAVIELGVWVELSKDQAAVTAALAGGAVVASTGVAVRWAGMSLEWVASWASTAMLALALAAGACFAGVVGHEAPGFAVAGGFGMAALGIALIAEPLRQPWLRETSAALAAASGAALLFALQPGSTELVFVTMGTGLAATAVMAVAQTFWSSSRWIRPLAIFGSAATAGALSVAGYELPRRDLLAAALLAAGAQSAVGGFVFRHLGPLLISPVLLCASWFTFATESLSGNPQWYTVPVGLTLIAIDELERDHYRRVGQRPTPPVIALEYIAMAFVVGSALAQEIATSLAYGLLALGLGLILAIWGLATHVRRRLFFGGGTATLAVLLMIAVPTAASAPGWSGPSLWVAVSILGLVAMAIAAGIEQGHARLHHFLVHMGQSLHDWE